MQASSPIWASEASREEPRKGDPFSPPPPAFASPLACLSRVHFSRYPPSGELLARYCKCNCTSKCHFSSSDNGVYLWTLTDGRKSEVWNFHYAKYIFNSGPCWETFYSPVTIRKDLSATRLAGPILDGPLEISDSSGTLPGQGTHDLASSGLQSEKEHSSLAVSLENNTHRVCTLLLM